MAADKKKSRRLGATLVFPDETGFLTQPYRGRTWGPIGRTPIIRHRVRHREKVTVLGSLTVSPARRRCGLYAEFFPGRSVNQQDMIRHFRRLRRTFRTPLVVVLDNLRQHRGKALRAWCASVGDVHLEYLPPYAPELNPTEGVWRHGKCVTAVGRVANDAKQLKKLASEAVKAAHKEHLLRGFIRGTRLPLAFDLRSRNHQNDSQ